MLPFRMPGNLFLFLSFVFALSLRAQQDATADGLEPPSIPSLGSIAATAASGAAIPAVLAPPMVIPAGSGVYNANAGQQGVDWAGVLRASGRFLVIEHAFRLATEPGTRDGLSGPFFRNYASAVTNLHGWADGDPFYVNYVGHPMQGAVAGFIWVGNDRKYRSATFGKNAVYWNSRLRAAAFAWAYSTQFEIGPLSEASIGHIQSLFPQQGFVDHVITPAVGLGWMITEDVMDRYVIQRIEGATTNRWIRMMVRGSLNPSRSFANVLQGNVPWHRETRPGISSYSATQAELTSENRPARVVRDVAGPAPFEFNTTFQTNRLWSGNNSVLCLGGGGTAAFRLAASWQLVAGLEGCKMVGPGQNLSGDSLTYMIGPRWVSRDMGSWNAYLHCLVGGNKITRERMFPEEKRVLEEAARRAVTPPPTHEDYTRDADSNGFIVSTGGGVAYKLNRALAIRVAQLSYQYTWAGPVFGRDYSNVLQFTSGLVLRMGTW